MKRKKLLHQVENIVAKVEIAHHAAEVSESICLWKGLNKILDDRFQASDSIFTLIFCSLKTISSGFQSFYKFKVNPQPYRSLFELRLSRSVRLSVDPSDQSLSE